MKRWTNCAQCGQPLAAALVETNGKPFCSGDCQRLFAEQVKRLSREESDRRDAALERQADLAGALRTGLIAAGLFVAVVLQDCDSPKDILGPDERAHIAAGRLVVR